MSQLMAYHAKDIGQLVKSTRQKLQVTQRYLALTAGTGLRFIITHKLKYSHEILA